MRDEFIVPSRILFGFFLNRSIVGLIIVPDSYLPSLSFNHHDLAIWKSNLSPAFSLCFEFGEEEDEEGLVSEKEG